MISPRSLACGPRRVTTVLCSLMFLLSAISSQAMAGIIIPAGASMSLNGGSIGLGDTSLDIAGTLQVDTGQLTGVLDVAVTAGGALSATTGLIALSGDWQMLGAFSAGNGEVRFVDGLSGVWNVFGSTQFASLSLLSSAGKHFVVEPGSTQHIAQLLTITGTAGQPLQVVRLPSGAVGQFDLQPSGSQSIAHVGVSDVHAIGQPLAPALTNEGGSGNAIGWFGSAVGAPATLSPELIPTSSPLALITLSLLLLLFVRSFGPFAPSRFS